VNPTPATRHSATSRCEFVPGLQAPGAYVKGFGKNPDSQKFAFAVLNTQ